MDEIRADSDAVIKLYRVKVRFLGQPGDTKRSATYRIGIDMLDQRADAPPRVSPATKGSGR